MELENLCAGYLPKQCVSLEWELESKNEPRDHEECFPPCETLEWKASSALLVVFRVKSNVPHMGFRVHVEVVPVHLCGGIFHDSAFIF